MTVVRRVLMGSLAGAALAVTGSASMADGYRGPKTAVAPAFKWTGFYIGAHAGPAWNDVRVRDLDGYNGPPDIRYDVEGGILGGQIGYNLQLQRVVLGIEAELGKMWLEEDQQYGPFIGVRLPTDSRAFLDTGLYATVAGRLGFLLTDTMLLYGKVGWGTVDAEVRFIDTDPTGAILVSGTRRSEYLDGAVYGGGVEFAMGKNITVKAEYLRFDVGDTIVHTATHNLGGTVRFAHDVRDIDTVKIGVSFKFDHDRVVPAPLK